MPHSPPRSSSSRCAFSLCGTPCCATPADAVSAILERLYRSLAPDGAVLDVGCFGFRQVELATRLGMTGLRHAGVDYNSYDDVPLGFDFRRADLSRELIPFAD